MPSPPGRHDRVIVARPRRPGLPPGLITAPFATAGGAGPTWRGGACPTGKTPARTGDPAAPLPDDGRHDNDSTPRGRARAGPGPAPHRGARAGPDPARFAP